MTEAQSQTPEQVLGDNVKVYRDARGLSQQGLADRMTRLGFSWTHNTASLTERGKRGVSLNEFAGLALVFGVKPANLLMARDPEVPRVAVGTAMTSAGTFNEWARGEWAMILNPDRDDAELLVITDQKSIAMPEQFDAEKLMLRRDAE